MMTNILAWVLIALTIVLVFLLPMALGLGLRLILKQARGWLIAVFAGVVIFLLNSMLMPWSELDAMVTKATQGMGVEIRLFMHVINIFIWVLACFGIPYLLASRGVAIAQNIINRRNPNNGFVRSR
jgi:hypothetical protein